MTAAEANEAYNSVVSSFDLITNLVGGNVQVIFAIFTVIGVIAVIAFILRGIMGVVGIRKIP